jgi:hypothetical protein
MSVNFKKQDKKVRLFFAFIIFLIYNEKDAGCSSVEKVHSLNHKYPAQAGGR